MTRIDTELVDESVTHLPVGLEGVGLTPATVLREHQLSREPFIQRV